MDTAHTTTGRDADAADAAFLHWLVFFTALAFVLWVLWQNDLVQSVVRTDPTRLSLVIMLIFAGGTLHCAVRSAYLSARLREITAIAARPAALQAPAGGAGGAGGLQFDAKPLPPSPVSEYLADVWRRRATAPDEGGKRDGAGNLDEVLAEKISGAHETGWFFAQLLVKLGLLGTVVGFIVMLTSISDTISYDAAHVPELFSGMTGGMRVALNTTLVGLVGTILLSFQYLMIDRAADRLLSKTTHFAATQMALPPPRRAAVDHPEYYR